MIRRYEAIIAKKPPVARGCARQVEAVTPSDVSADRNRRTGSAVGLDKSLFANRNYLAITLEKRRYRALSESARVDLDRRAQWRDGCSLRMRLPRLRVSKKGAPEGG